MRKTNKTLSALLATVMLTWAMTSVAFAHDPFNNDLFTVEKEITFEDGSHGQIRYFANLSMIAWICL